MKIPPIFLLAFTAVSLSAQPGSVSSSPGLLQAFNSSYSFSAKENVTHGAPVGEVAVHAFEASAEGRRRLSETDTLIYALTYTATILDQTTGTPLPDQLNDLGVRLGLSHRFTSEWSASVSATPGLYGDFEDVDGKTFNVPVLALATYRQSPELVWAFGARVNAYSDYPVLPIAGVRWQFAPGWSFDVGVPRTGVSWQVMEDLTLRGSLTFQGGTYRITENLGVPANSTRRLANTFLDYREFRVGLGAELALGERSSLGFDVGAMLDRTFDYFDRDYELDGDAGVFAVISLQLQM